MDFSSIVWTTELRFAVALALGFLVGLERESIKSEQKFVFGGVRTHPIISMFGFACGWLYNSGATAMLPAGMLAIGALTVVAYVAKIRADRFGSTSEISALLTFVTGAMCMLADIWIAMALGVINTILLSEKAMLESYVERLSKVEFLATVKFLLVTVIILPVLPNQEFTAFHINPTKVWHIVILVSTIGFVGYLLERKFGRQLGLWMSGALGGIVSSTALTLAVGRMARTKPHLAANALQASLLASSVMYLRVLALIWFLNPGFLPNLWYRLVILAVIGILLSLRVRQPDAEASGTNVPELQNPFEIRPAIGFAIIFVVLSVVTGLVRQHIGDAGLLGLSAIVGVSDIDPFILSLIQGSDGTLRILTSAIILSMMSNTIAKATYFAFLSPTTRKETVLKYSVWAALHVPFIVL
jgi:uncharacterized membrane protein (DUF4010 family)